MPHIICTLACANSVRERIMVGLFPEYSILLNDWADRCNVRIGLFQWLLMLVFWCNKLIAREYRRLALSAWAPSLAVSTAMSERSGSFVSRMCAYKSMCVCYPWKADDRTWAIPLYAPSISVKVHLVCRDDRTSQKRPTTYHRHRLLSILLSQSSIMLFCP